MTDTANEGLHQLALRLTPGIGEMHHARLVAHFGSAERAIACRDVGALRAAGLPLTPARQLVVGAALKEAERQLRIADRHGARIVCARDGGWPTALAALLNPPPILWVRGAWPLEGPWVSIVGTRAPDAYGLARAAQLAAHCASAGVGVVSGGALGIDAAAHEGALRGGGRTVVVLGSGLDVPYPVAHAQLFERVVESGGALLSELPFGAQPSAGTFPRRNRIIAALGEVVVVVQAASRSGALITAAEAKRLKRMLLAVPGAVDRRVSSGVHHLLREGAGLCEGIEDILPHLRRSLSSGAASNDERARSPVKHAESSAPRRPPNGLSEEAARVYGALTPEEATFDTLVARTALEPMRVAAALVDLELDGHVTLTRGYYQVR